MSGDWRNAHDYDYTAALTLRAWAWEFLRRNSAYRNAWAEWGLDRPGCGDKNKALATRDAATWGLRCALNPTQRADQIQKTAADFVWWRSELMAANVFVLNKDHLAETVSALPDQIEFLGFDMHKPVDPQMKQARALLSRLREARRDAILKPKIKGHRKLWRQYLRALDGDEQGEQLREIAAVLLNDPAGGRDIYDTIRQAKRLVESGYRLILALEDSGKPRRARRKLRKL